MNPVPVAAAATDERLLSSIDTADVGEVAQAFARCIWSFPESSARQLKELLEADLGRDAPGPGLNAQLGPLVGLLAENGELIDSSVYDAARRAASRRGEHWPSRQSLCRSYGAWWRVVLTAARRLRRGLATRMTRSNAYRKHHDERYERHEVLDAVIACARFVGAWPSKWLYLEWAAARRMAARQNSMVPTPRLPAANAIKRHYADWNALHQDARRRLAESLEAPSR
jgi:hypothetical protein